MAAIAAAASSHLMFVLRSQPLSSSFISFLKPLLLSIPQRCFYAPSTYPCSTASKTCLRYFLLRFLKMAKKQRLRMMNWKLKEVILKTCLRYFHFNWFTVSQCSFLVSVKFFKILDPNLQPGWCLQIKIRRSCPGELDDVVKQLEAATGSVAVGQIGRTLIIYRPSLSKMKAEEKKKQNRNLILKKQVKPRLGKEQVPKLSWPGSSWKGRKKKVGHKTHSDYVDLCPGAWPEQA
ncbi:hypothetical protein JHK82_032735 [Glycine max]|nr:hypothetical protein JHK85_033440 [Glycine max]KAG5118315.1 hypothetical protein JHK82_032735 [Glycine max]KAG5139299.1 hypothetical protein JHK84_033067 [Glycine max]